MDMYEPMPGFAVVATSIYLETSGALMIKPIGMIETEVNDLIGYIWASIEPVARKENGYEQGQHGICHIAAEVYSTFKDSALQCYTETGSESLWELVELLTDKMLACDPHFEGVSK